MSLMLNKCRAKVGIFACSKLFIYPQGKFKTGIIFALKSL